ncbi:MazG family protein [Anoxynatronum buryatiense]|uniref:Tetrapyrrole methylase family protein / MazG family protein n=1 Tax=Anoxynatronum buryatiense TaxID=489973 RepID=A0AA46AIL2_9CLOT|nr:MazG family protein [Anoxynatronum buryatiense]SMP51621.1 tetrapyrrole methylase family protein / MazG family protein [Anoxynatronum buryatiense]
MPTLTIAGLGPGALEQLPLGTWQLLKAHPSICLRTEKHPLVADLKAQGIHFQTFDHIYETEENFEDVYREIVRQVLALASEGDLLYAVPGHPNVAEETVRLLRKALQAASEEETPVLAEGITLKIVPAMSFLDVIFPLIDHDPVDGFMLIDALSFHRQPPDTNMDVIITQVYDPYVASELKLGLMHYYDAEQPIKVIKSAGVVGEEEVREIPLYQLDHQKDLDYLTSIYIARVDRFSKIHYNMNHLMDMLEKLRGSDGCPWDRKQTHESLKPYLTEESQEVLDAIDGGDDDDLCEELGDVLLQVVFHSQIAKERGAFTMHEVVHGITQKIIFRHPHVFGDETAETPEDVKAIWAIQKAKEKTRREQT